MNLRFQALPDGAVTAAFSCEPDYQGYPDCIHGGVIAMLHDAAMVNCLLHHGAEGVTARMTIRYNRPLELGEEANVRAWIERSNSPIYQLKSVIMQGGMLRSEAEGLFCRKDGMVSSSA